MLSTIDKMMFIRRMPLFASMTLKQGRALSAHLDYRHLLSGEVIFADGEFSQELYLIVSGVIAIVKHHGASGERVLNTLGPGDFFGEMAIFEQAPRSAAAVAKTETELLMLQATTFKQTIYQKPDLAFELFRELSARLRRREEAIRLS